MRKIFPTLVALWVIYAILAYVFQQNIFERAKAMAVKEQQELAVLDLVKRAPRASVDQVNLFATSASACIVELQFSGVKPGQIAMLAATFGLLSSQVYRPVSQKQMDKCIDDSLDAAGIPPSMLN